MAKKLVKHSLYRVIYSVTPTGEPPFVGRRKTVVSDGLQEAIDRVREHEASECPDNELVITEVVRENIEVWS
jgi:hypothetical protein